MKSKIFAFVLVITNPYEGLDYNKLNVYDVNYCNYYCYNPKEDYSSFYDSLDEEIRDEFEDEEEKPLIFDLDFWDTKK